MYRAKSMRSTAPTEPAISIIFSGSPCPWLAMKSRSAVRGMPTVKVVRTARPSHPPRPLAMAREATSKAKAMAPSSGEISPRAIGPSKSIVTEITTKKSQNKPPITPHLKNPELSTLPLKRKEARKARSQKVSHTLSSSPRKKPKAEGKKRGYKMA